MLRKLKKDIDKSLDSFLKDTKSSYKLHLISKTLFQGIQDFLVRDGKRIRPIFFIISYLGYTEKKHPAYKKLLRASLALELFHDFMLVHDDVIDKSALRRGRPTLHRFFNSKLGIPAQDELGENLSIVAGDVIFALAIDSFLEIKEDLHRKQMALRKLVETAAFTGVGEFLDVINGVRKIENITNKDVFINYTFKTAKYTFECPLLIGAILSGIDKKELKKLSRIGINLGLAFQIQDDMLDIFSSSKAIGKPILSDLIESKKTLMVWKAYRDSGSKDKKKIKNILERKHKSHKDLTELRKLIKKTQAHMFCINKIFSLIKEADKTCSQLKMKSRYKKLIANFIHDLFSKTEALKESF